MRYAISYVSTAAPGLDEKQVEEIFKKTNAHNNGNGITGILLFSEGNFFQVIEGEKSIILDLYDKIQQDKRHQNIIKIFGREIKEENFVNYETEFISEKKKQNLETVDDYLNNIRSLDQPSQNAVRNILSAFLDV